MKNIIIIIIVLLIVLYFLYDKNENFKIKILFDSYKNKWCKEKIEDNLKQLHGEWCSCDNMCLSSKCVNNICVDEKCGNTITERKEGSTTYFSNITSNCICDKDCGNNKTCVVPSLCIDDYKVDSNFPKKERTWHENYYIDIYNKRKKNEKDYKKIYDEYIEYKDEWNKK